MKQIINSFNHITFKLFLCNAGTSKNNEEDLKTAKRLKTAPFKISDTKVCKIPIISYSHSCSHSSDKYLFIFIHTFQTAPSGGPPSLCPHTWFHLGSGRGDYGDLCWRLLFLCFCVPFCYPCYLSRQVRRRQGQARKYHKKIAQFFNTFSILHLVT